MFFGKLSPKCDLRNSKSNLSVMGSLSISLHIAKYLLILTQNFAHQKIFSDSPQNLAYLIIFFILTQIDLDTFCVPFFEAFL